MSKTNKTKLLTILVLAFICCVASVFVTIGIKANAATLGDVAIEEVYLQGTSFVVPDAKITVGQTEYDSEKYLVFPDGKKYSLEKTDLSVCGVYKIEYKAEVDGKVYRFYKLFKVEQYNYSHSGAKYEADGLHFVLSSADKTFTLNSVVDLSTATLDDVMYSFSVYSDENNNIKTDYIYTKFTDVYDSDNYVTIRSGIYFNNSMTYTVCSVGNSAFKGNYAGSVHNDGNPSSTLGSVSVYRQNYRMDYAERSVHVDNCVFGSEYSEVVDFDSPLYFTSLWQGFTTGECYVTMYPGAIKSDNIAITLHSVYGVDLSEQALIDDTDAPSIIIDYGEFTENTYPNAIVGSSYSLFDAAAYDISGLNGEKVIPRIYFGYGTTSCYEIDAENGRFTTDRAGVYSLVYSATDKFGNVAEKVVTIKCVESLESFAVSIDADFVNGIEVGTQAVLPEISVSGNVGKYKLFVAVKKGDDMQEIEYVNKKYFFSVKEGGAYTLVIKATDYLERVASAEYPFTIEVENAPKFIGELELPAYLYDGYAFNVPEFNAYNYSTKQDVPVEVYLTDKNGKNKVENGVCTPEVENSYDKVTLTYKAGETEISKEVSVLKVGSNGELNKAEFFLKNTAVETEINGSYFTFITQNDAAVKYSNKILAEDFAMHLEADKSRNGFNAITVYMYDSEDSDVALKISFVRSGDKVKAYVNDSSLGIDVNSSFISGVGKKIMFEFKNSTKYFTIDGKSLGVGTDLNGNEFNGFPSKYVNIEIAAEGVTGTAGVQIYSISKQTFTTDGNDYIRPSYYIDGSFGGAFTKDSEYVFNRILSGDVLSQQCSVTYTVLKPSGGVVTSNEGVSLKNVSGNDVYTCSLTEIGSYRVTVKVSDQNDNTTTFIYLIYVLDTEKPVIVMNGNVTKSAKQGDTVSLPSATTVEDKANLLGEKVYVNIIRPDGICEMLKENKFKATQKGVYKVCYYAIDTSYNMAELYFEIVVG